jgi:hypothetical protein
LNRCPSGGARLSAAGTRACGGAPRIEHSSFYEVRASYYISFIVSSFLLTLALHVDGMDRATCAPRWKSGGARDGGMVCSARHARLL